MQGTHLVVCAHHAGTIVGSVDGRARVAGARRGDAVPPLILRHKIIIKIITTIMQKYSMVRAAQAMLGSYLVATGHCRRRLHLLGDDALLLLGGIMGAGGGHRLLLQLLGLGILAQILVRGGGAGGDSGGRDIGATQVGGCCISLRGKWSWSGFFSGLVRFLKRKGNNTT